MKTWQILFLIVIILTKTNQAQTNNVNNGQWKSISFNGLISLESIYRAQENILNNGRVEEPVTQRLFGQLRLDSRSYIWHPSFLQVNSRIPLVGIRTFLLYSFHA